MLFCVKSGSLQVSKRGRIRSQITPELLKARTRDTRPPPTMVSDSELAERVTRGRDDDDDDPPPGVTTSSDENEHTPSLDLTTRTLLARSLYSSGPFYNSQVHDPRP